MSLYAPAVALVVRRRIVEALAMLGLVVLAAVCVLVRQGSGGAALFVAVGGFGLVAAGTFAVAMRVEVDPCQHILDAVGALLDIARRGQQRIATATRLREPPHAAGVDLERPWRARGRAERRARSRAACGQPPRPRARGLRARAAAVRVVRLPRLAAAGAGGGAMKRSHRVDGLCHHGKYARRATVCGVAIASTWHGAPAVIVRRASAPAGG
jgi:hypothetical protein